MQAFEQSAAMVREVLVPSRRLSNDQLLVLYGLYKQATVGDVSGSRPILDLKGGAKWDAWAELRGLPAEAAREAYVAEVQSYVQSA